MARYKDYPFPDLGHRIMLTPAPEWAKDYTLDDLISGKAVVAVGPTARCQCGVEVPIPGGSIKAFAKGLNGIAGNTYMMFNVGHILDGVTSTEEASKKLMTFREKRGKQAAIENKMEPPAKSK